MENLQKLIIRNGITNQIKWEEIRLHKRWEERVLQEEKIWKQKSWIIWLKSGEHNYSLFHCSIIQYRRHHKILGHKSKQGSTIHTHEDIVSELNEYFNNLLKEPRIDKTREIKEITHNIPVILNQDHNKMLLREVTMQEVEEVIISMLNGKSHRHDAFTIDFYKTYWPFSLLTPK